jgi:hypothetical protein
LGSWLLLLGLPLVIRLVTHGYLPEGFGTFPPQRQTGIPGFHLGTFVIMAGTAIGVLVFLGAPSLFGFRGASQPRSRAPVPRVSFPVWFWPGLVTWLVSWGAMWSQSPALGELLHYTFVPLWWGFIAALDGWVYRRTGGQSLFARRPLTMAAIAAASSIGWFYFEYLDYFVSSNWYYPHADALPESLRVVWFGLSYTTILPSIFEVYALLRTFDGLAARYTGGPRWRPTRRAWWTILGLGVLLSAAVAVGSTAFFWAIWIGPLLILTPALALAGCWTPFTPMRDGDWSKVVLISLASLFNYLLGECWNFWSAPGNPHFWKYEVPFVNAFQLFEMPLLGYFGYLPFGMFCWIWWLHSAHVLGLAPEFELSVSRPEPITVSRAPALEPRGG